MLFWSDPCLTRKGDGDQMIRSIPNKNQFAARISLGLKRSDKVTFLLKSYFSASDPWKYNSSSSLNTGKSDWFCACFWFNFCYTTPTCNIAQAKTA